MLRGPRKELAGDAVLRVCGICFRCWKFVGLVLSCASISPSDALSQGSHSCGFARCVVLATTQRFPISSSLGSQALLRLFSTLSPATFRPMVMRKSLNCVVLSLASGCSFLVVVSVPQRFTPRPLQVNCHDAAPVMQSVIMHKCASFSKLSMF
jgi:hypothetical protein